MERGSELPYGAVVRATVASIIDEGVMVETADQTAMFVPSHEWSHRSDGEAPAPGSSVDVEVIVPASPAGVAVASRRRAILRQRWAKLDRSRVTGEVVAARVRDRGMGGFIVDVEGVLGRLPRAAGPLEDGSTTRVTVTEASPLANILIVSDGLPPDEYFVGQRCMVKVRAVVPYGAFVTDWLTQGLVHKTVLAREPVDDPTSVVSVGQVLEVEVCGVDRAKGQVSFSRKAVLPHPFDEFVNCHTIGEELDGVVANIVNFGAFVTVDGIDGLLHVTEIPGAERKAVHALLTPGEPLKVVIIDIDRDARRVSLSLNGTRR